MSNFIFGLLILHSGCPKSSISPRGIDEATFVSKESSRSGYGPVQEGRIGKGGHNLIFP